jgi:hypothetical protein
MEFIMLKVFVRQNSSGYGTNEELWQIVLFFS